MKYCFFIIILFINIICIRKKELFISDIKSQFEQFDIDNKKNYPLVTLGYITPWNKEGYDYVKKYSEKFDIISPTWFELKPEEIDGEFQIILDGSNNVDSSYMKDLKNKNKKILILPRLHVGFNEQKLFNIWFTKESDQFVKVLERRIKYNKFDGYVFDCMAIWFNKNLMEKFIKYFLPKIYESMNKLKKTFILTILPKNNKDTTGGNYIDKNTFKLISKYVHYFNIMTYDYHQYINQNKNYFTAPISWIKETINFYVDNNDKDANELLQKILIGIPFHGYSFNTDTGREMDIITGKQFPDILNKGIEDMEYISNENEGEYLLLGKKNAVNYPEKKFISKRLELSKELKVGGIGIWDVGNGKESMIEPL
jgi:spore germination protein YaaH